ncbi:MAG: glycosyltransferase family 8 protein [Candidatus Onthoplasma sp.]
MNKNTIIPIVFSCDDKYIPFLAVALESMEENASRNYEYDIKVLHAKTISEENQKKIIEKYSKDVFRISFDDISREVETIATKLHTRDYYSKSTYYRLFIPNLYKEYDKVLYLDSDIVVRGDISKLFNTELGNNLVGAIPDEFVQTTPIIYDYVENHIPLGKGNHGKYFNAGILLMNNKRLREIDFEGKFIDLIGKVKFQVAQDQDYLNCICRGKVKYISPLWNKQPFPSKIYKEKDLKIIHYNLDSKPWQKDGVLYEDEFWKYAKQSGFIDEILQVKASFNEEKIAFAAKQTENLIKMIIEQGHDVVDNARIKAIVDSIFDEKESPLVKSSVVVKDAETEENDIFEVIDKVVAGEPNKQSTK